MVNWTFEIWDEDLSVHDIVDTCSFTFNAQHIFDWGGVTLGTCGVNTTDLTFYFDPI
jgi:hypothetical protein